MAITLLKRTGLGRPITTAEDDADKTLLENALAIITGQTQGTVLGRAAGAGTGPSTALTPDQLSAIISLLADAAKIALFRDLGVRGAPTPNGNVAVFDAAGALGGVDAPLFSPSNGTYVTYDAAGEEANLLPPEVASDIVIRGLSKLEQSVTGNFTLTLQGFHSSVVVTLIGNATLIAISGMAWPGPGGIIPLHIIQGGAGGFTLSESSSSIFLHDPTTLTDISPTVGAVTRLHLLSMPNGTWVIRKPPVPASVLALGNISGNFTINVKDFHRAVTGTLVGNATIIGVSGAIDAGPCGTIDMYFTQDATGGRTLLESAAELNSAIDTDALTLITTPGTTTMKILQALPNGTFALLSPGRSF